ncbi:hypothetical protein SBV1_670001 [Verrucomicrobia bacterium]|nr:hypothetical protein SBV1_670001 [Verrucomicrobiota bacterium]
MNASRLRHQRQGFALAAFDKPRQSAGSTDCGDETSPPLGRSRRLSELVIPSDFVIRHSSFLAGHSSFVAAAFKEYATK